MKPPILSSVATSAVPFFLLLLLSSCSRTIRSISLSPRVITMLSKMSLQDKIGQMTQIDINKILSTDAISGKGTLDITLAEKYLGTLGVGSIFNTPDSNLWSPSQWRTTLSLLRKTTLQSQRPPILYGLDSTHGANYVAGAILAPQPLNIAATFDPRNAEKVGRLGARDSRASGIGWIFAPVLGLGVQPLWPRFYETFGESPLLARLMGHSWIKGTQATGSAACAKHFVGYSNPLSGHDRTPAWIPRRWLREYFLEPFKDAVEGGVLSLMESYGEVDGVPMAENRELVGTLLREEWGFEGVIVTDFREIENLANWHHVAGDLDEAVALSLKETGIDMSMTPYDPEGFIERVTKAVTDGVISVERINESAGRILALKERLGLFDGAIEGDMDSVGSDVDKFNMMKIVKDSIVLAKNENDALPLRDIYDTTIFVTGPTADSLRYQTGGWTFSWQGDEDDARFTYGDTVLKSLQQHSKEVDYSCGVDIGGNECEPDSVTTAVNNAKIYDYVVVCVGEANYAEKPGDIDDLSLPEGQIELVHRLRHETTAKIIVVYFGGRPRLLGDITEHCDALLLAFLPGPDAGHAIFDIMIGIHNPSAKLPFTYPRTQSTALPHYHGMSSMCTEPNPLPSPHANDYNYVPCPIEFPFGHGLSYTTFSYDNLSYSSTTLSKSQPIQVDIRVTNTGPVKGSETVFFFSFDHSRYVTPSYKTLRHFEKVKLDIGESTVVSFSLALDDVRYVGHENDVRKVLQHGMTFHIGVGHTTDCRKTEYDPLCTSALMVDAGEGYIAECEAACNVWKRTKCGLKEEKCLDLCRKEGERGWGWNYVDCIESIAQQISRHNHSSLSYKIDHIMNNLNNIDLVNINQSSISHAAHGVIDNVQHSNIWHSNFSLHEAVAKMFEPKEPITTCHDMTLMCRNIYATTFEPALETTMQCMESAFDTKTSLIMLGVIYAISILVAIYLIIKAICRYCRKCCCGIEDLSEEEVVRAKSNVEMTSLTGNAETKGREDDERDDDDEEEGIMA